MFCAKEVHQCREDVDANKPSLRGFKIVDDSLGQNIFKKDLRRNFKPAHHY
jgi:hypothetical protein